MILGAINRRPGAMSLLSLMTIPALILVVGLVVYVGMVRETKTESQNGADAASLAAARALATDDLLTNNRTRAENRIKAARQAARALGHENFAAGDRLELDANLSNDQEGDIVFGNLDHPQGGTFRVALPDPADWLGNRINAVQVTTRRPPVRSPIGPSSDRDLRARAVAMIDHHVVGFRPNDDEPIPLMPVAVFTDHTGENTLGWDHHCRRVKKDDWRYDYQAKKFVAGADEIPEVGVAIGKRGRNQGVPGVFLQIGADSFAETVAQVRAGITREQLERKFGRDFVLNNDNGLDVPGSPDCPPPGSQARQSIDRALRAVAESGEPRIWPLFSEVDEDRGIVRVNGWMAARLVQVGSTESGGIRLVLQPAVLPYRAAVTEQRKNPPVYWANNNTVFRVRLAE